MAVRSRNSLRFSVRRDQEILPPPTKRPRLHNDSSPPLPSSSSSSRRKSSPDLLETTIENETPKYHHSPNPRQLSARRHPLPTPRTASRRPLPLSPNSDTPRLKGTLDPRHEPTPTSASASIFFRGARESPDPLDTISPVPSTKTRAPLSAPGSSPVTTRSRQRPETGQNAAKLDAPRVEQKNTGSAQSAGANGSPKRERRSLRSHDGNSRQRSELALYFPNYEQLLSLEPPKTEVLTGHTTIKLVDDLSTPLSFEPKSETPFGNPLVNLHNCEVVELPDVPEAEDPLNEAFYFRPHRRIERQEKQLRNIERERAQHEKLQLDRLLEELRSYDWLRVMGINGITDLEEKKLYEPKRDFFIKELSSIIDKFKIWKEEEKRRKFEKERAPVLQETAEVPSKRKPETKDEDENPSNDATSDSGTPDIDDVDAQAARQLHQEAQSATAGKRPKSQPAPRRKSKPTPSKEPKSDDVGIKKYFQKKQPDPIISPLRPPPPPPEPDKPFTSFFSSPSARDAAFAAHNRHRRNRLAFGNPIPDMEEREFVLPAEILTEEMITACQRKRRRMKRESRGK